MKCFIMRGLPGSGKSHWVRANYPEFQICSADKWFNAGGVYRFDPDQLKNAHNFCLRTFVADVRDERPIVIVDNTNVRLWEIAPYYRIAESFGYEVEIVWLQTDPEVCKQRNVHGVPPGVIDRMARSFDPLPDWWNVRIVCDRG